MLPERRLLLPLLPDASRLMCVFVNHAKHKHMRVKACFRNKGKGILGLEADRFIEARTTVRNIYSTHFKT